jgi:hypothetical protein
LDMSSLMKRDWGLAFDPMKPSAGARCFLIWHVQNNLDEYRHINKNVSSDNRAKTS